MNKISTHTLNLFSAYTSNEITDQEFQDLEQWINKSSKNKELFLDYLHFYKKTRRIGFVDNIDRDKAWNNILLQLEKPLKSVPIHKKDTSKVNYLKSISSILKYAAVVVLLLGIGYLYQSGYFTTKPTIIIPEDSITLQLENGNIKIISENGKTKIADSKGNIVGAQKGNQLIYNNKVEKETLVYNKLTVPYGKRFEVQLSDGTIVHLNAGTSLKYPVKFIKGKNRQVYLKGEAFFTVSKDANHPFIVNADEIDIRVLGTQFNVSSYPEDKDINTVLIEGAVSIYNKGETYNPNKATVLKPGFKASWKRNSNQTTVEKADTEIYTAWMKGSLILKEVAFNDILKKLERQYDVTIINNNKSLENRYFTAKFDIEAIHLVMENLIQYASFSYEFKGNLIIINP